MIAAFLQHQRRGLQGQPDALAQLGSHRLREAEGGRHHADDSACLVIHPDRLAHDVWIGVKGRAPQAFGEKNDLGAVRFALLRGEGATQERLYAEHGEEIGADVGRDDRGGRDFALHGGGGRRGDRHVALDYIALDYGDVFRVDGDLREAVRGLVLDIAVVQPGSGTVRYIDPGADDGKAAGISVGKGPQQNVFRHGEHRGVGADRQGQRDDRQGGEAGGDPKLANRPPRILPKNGHPYLQRKNIPDTAYGNTLPLHARGRRNACKATGRAEVMGRPLCPHPAGRCPEVNRQRDEQSLVDLSGISATMSPDTSLDNGPSRTR